MITSFLVENPEKEKDLFRDRKRAARKVVFLIVLKRRKARNKSMKECEVQQLMSNWIIIKARLFSI